MKVYKLWQNLVVLVVLLVSAFSATAQYPMIGLDFPDVYLSSEKASPIGYQEYVRTGTYGWADVYVIGADRMITGAAFRLTDPGNLLFLDTWTPYGVTIGDLFTGIEIGLTTPLLQFQTAVTIARFFYIVPLDAATSYASFMEVQAHPHYDAPKLTTTGGEIFDANGGLYAINVVRTPVIGLYFDNGGTVTSGSYTGGEGEIIPSWLLLRYISWIEHVSAVETALDLPPGFAIHSVELPEGGTMTGDLTSGAVLAYDPVLWYLPAPVVLAKVNLTASQINDNAQISPIGFGGDAKPRVVYTGGDYYFADTMVTHISVPIPNADVTWGAVKILYK